MPRVNVMQPNVDEYPEFRYAESTGKTRVVESCPHCYTPLYFNKREICCDSCNFAIPKEKIVRVKLIPTDSLEHPEEYTHWDSELGENVPLVDPETGEVRDKYFFEMISTAEVNQ